MTENQNEPAGVETEEGKAAGTPKADSQDGGGKEIVALLKDMFSDQQDKRFEWLAKQYYDLFSYHAAQRLTAFNFFIVSLSFFSNAFALFVTRANGSDTYFELATSLAMVAWLLTLFFARLDKRNEQIIQINEKPLKKLQQAVAEHFQDEGADLLDEGHASANVFRTFREADRSHLLLTFGSILPWIFTLAAFACLAGAAYSANKAVLLPECSVLWVGIGLVIATCLVVHFPLFPKRKPIP